MIVETDVQHAICLITELGNSLKKIRGGPFPTDLLSTLGELKVFLELKKRFPNAQVSFKRKARADISVGRVNIEVKTSNLKTDDYGRSSYGFALHIKKCKSHPEAFFQHPIRSSIPGDFCYLHYLICVAVDEKNLESPNYYIFSREELNENTHKIENTSKRFWWAPYRILIPVVFDLTENRNHYDDFVLELARDKQRFKDRWDKIVAKVS